MKSNEDSSAPEMEPQVSSKRIRAPEVEAPLWMQPSDEKSEPSGLNTLSQPSNNPVGTQDNVPLWMRPEGETIESPAIKPPEPSFSSNRLRPPIESTSSGPMQPRKSPLRDAESDLFTNKQPIRATEGDLFSKPARQEEGDFFSKAPAPARQAEGDFFSKAPSQTALKGGNLFSPADPTPGSNEGNLFSVNPSARKLEPDRNRPFAPFNDAKPINSEPDVPVKMTAQPQIINDLDEEDLLL